MPLTLYCYFYEKNITSASEYPRWENVAEVLIDERERIRETFAQLSYLERTFAGNCWCGNEAFVKVESDNNTSVNYFCNFHYRKKFYRDLSNGIDSAKNHVITDERMFMKKTISEEAEGAGRV